MTDAARDTTLPLTPAATRVVELAANLDDVSAEVVGDAQHRLLEAGALDVWTTAIGMKKQRPGVMLSVLCDEADRDRLAALVLQLTGSFGVRFRDWQRTVLQREHVQAQTRFGPVRVKVGRLAGQVLVARPEYEDVRQLAERSGQPMRVVMQVAEAAAATLMERQDAGE